MRRVLLVGAVLLLLPCLAVAQYGVGATSEWRGGVNWTDMGDFGDGFGVEVDYIHYFGRAGLMVSLEWADVNLPTKGIPAVKNRYGAALGYLYNLALRNGYQPFVGAAVTYTHLDNAVDDGCVGGRVLGGATLGSHQQWFLQAGYDFATDLFGGANVNGPRFGVGLSF